MINSNQTALLVIDVQNDFCSPEGAMGKTGKDLSYVENTIPQLVRSINQCRDEGITIIFIKTVHSPLTDSEIWVARGAAAKRACIDDWGRQLYKVQPYASDPVIVKNRYSAFVGTNLDLILRSKGITNLLIAGFTTNVCVESTARDGFMKDYRTITLSDCTACYEEREHESAIFNLGNYFGQAMYFEEAIRKLQMIV